MLGLFKKSAGEAVKKFSGQTDFLEGVCATAALIAAADGDIGDDEVAATKKAVLANKGLAEGFDTRTIETTIDRMLDRASAGRSGKAGLLNEIDEVAKDPAKAEAVLYAAIDVAESDGEIGAKERLALENLAKRLSLNLDQLLSAV